MELDTAPEDSRTLMKAIRDEREQLIQAWERLEREQREQFDTPTNGPTWSGTAAAQTTNAPPEHNRNARTAGTATQYGGAATKPAVSASGRDGSWAAAQALARQLGVPTSSSANVRPLAPSTVQPNPQSTSQPQTVAARGDNANTFRMLQREFDQT